VAKKWSIGAKFADVQENIPFFCISKVGHKNAKSDLSLKLAAVVNSQKRRKREEYHAMQQRRSSNDNR